MTIKRAFDIDMIGRYAIMETVGIGGFGVVYKGRDPYIGRELAIKVSTLDEVGADRSEIDSFLRKLFIEAEAAGQLIHPNIVTIFDVGIEEPYYFVAMEYIDGRNLKFHCHRDRALALADALDVTIRVCHGLDYAHQRGIIHRDVKSTNILLGKRGEIKIADFGLAYILDIKESQTEYAGTPSYMAPEVVQRKTPTARSDIFSLGVVLYELLTGEKPFKGNDLDKLSEAIVSKPHPPITSHNADIPPSLSALVDRALNKEPEKRFQDTMELARSLDFVLHSGEVSLSSAQKQKIDMLRSLMFFSDFSDDEISKLLQIGTWLSYKAGEVIVEQHESDQSFFVITSGTAAALHGKKKLNEMSRGQCFGEISFLLSAKRSATVCAQTECQLLKLNPKKIDILPAESQAKIYRIFSKTLANRLLAADERSR